MQLVFLDYYTLRHLAVALCRLSGFLNKGGIECDFEGETMKNEFDQNIIYMYKIIK